MHLHLVQWNLTFSTPSSPTGHPLCQVSHPSLTYPSHLSIPIPILFFSPRRILLSLFLL